LYRQKSLFRNCVQCTNCIEYNNCGGCHSTCQYESCSMSCFNCVSICCIHPHLSKYLTDIQGTDFPDFHSFKIGHISLPGIIPSLTYAWDAEKPYPFEWVAIGINSIYGEKGIKIEHLKNLHERFRLPKETNIILVNHGYDYYIEDYWRYADNKGYIEALAHSNLKLATGFNYSLFDFHSRMSHLISLKKTLITTKELLNSGLYTIPHLYWKTKKDIERWIIFLKTNNIHMASVNFTYKKNLKDFIRTANERLSQQPWKLKWRFPAQIWHNGFGKQPKPYREVTANVSIPQEGRSVDRKECLPVTNGAIDSIRFTGSCERTI
jgi:hypothetical protein